MQENSKIDFKIGDLVTIKSEPMVWSSLCCSNDPLDKSSPIEYPYTAKIEDIKIDDDHYDKYLGAKIGNYGWQLSYLIENDLITNVNPPENEIIPIPEKLMTVYDKKFPTYRKKRVVFAKIGNTYLAWATKEKLFAERWDFVEEIQ